MTQRSDARTAVRQGRISDEERPDVHAAVCNSDPQVFSSKSVGSKCARAADVKLAKEKKKLTSCQHQVCYTPVCPTRGRQAVRMHCTVCFSTVAINKP